MSFKPTPIDTTVSQTNALPTELTRSALSEGILNYFNDQLSEAWPVQTHARIDEITSIQRALNILKRALGEQEVFLIITLQGTCTTFYSWYVVHVLCGNFLICINGWVQLVYLDGAALTSLSAQHALL